MKLKNIKFTQKFKKDTQSYHQHSHQFSLKHASFKQQHSFSSHNGYGNGKFSDAMKEVYGSLPAHLQKVQLNIQSTISQTVRNAPARSITNYLTHNGTRLFGGKTPKELFPIVRGAVDLTHQSPIYIKPEKGGFLTNRAIFRQLALNTWHICEMADSLQRAGLEVDEGLFVDAFKSAHGFSKTPAAEKLIRRFDQVPPPRAYDLKRVKEMYKSMQSMTGSELQESHLEENLETWLINWAEESKKHETQKDTAGKMFDKNSFSIEHNFEGMMSYNIGVWAGIFPTGLSQTIVNSSEHKNFFGYPQGTGWVASRIATADNNDNVSFWMPTDVNGCTTREGLAYAFTMFSLLTAQELSGGHGQSVNRPHRYYFDTLASVLKSITEAQQVVYEKSHELPKALQQLKENEPQNGRG